MVGHKENAQARFEEIRRYFLQGLKDCGHARTELYYRPKPGDERVPTEEEVVRKWANETRIPLRDVLIGIQNAFTLAAQLGHDVRSFRYCEPQIIRRWNEVKDARVGSARG